MLSELGSELQWGSSVSPDDDVFIHLAKTYSFTHKSMHNGNSCYDSKDFKDGITNGFNWYPLKGQPFCSSSWLLSVDLKSKLN